MKYAPSVIWVFLLLLIASPTDAQENGEASATAKPIDDATFQPLDIFELEYASNPQVSPDGSRIIYTRNHFDIMSDRRKSDIWMVDEQGRHLPLLTSGNVGATTWSPDGSRIAYVTSNEDGKSQIFNYWFADNRSAPLSRLTQSPSGLTWSPDGKQIAFFMRVPATQKPFVAMPAKPAGATWAAPPKMITKLQYRSDGRGFLKEGYSQLFVMSADGGTPRQITSGNFNHGGNICWTPDSSAIIFSANRHPDSEFQPQNSELYRVNLADRNITALTDRKGPDSSPALSSDGRLLAYTGFDDEYLGSQCRHLYVMNSDGSDSRILANINRSISSPVWSDFYEGFLFNFTDHGNSKLALVKLDGTVQTLANNLGSNATGRPYTRGGRASVGKNGTIAFCITTPSHPGDLARLNPGKKLERLTNLNEDLLAHKTLGKVTEMTCKSSFDGQEIQGWVITPPDFDPNKKYPLILEIHGGPFSAYGDVFTGELQLMAAAGYVVLYTNPRGSTSYGQAFANEIHHNYPGQDYDDLMSCVDALLKQGYVDEDQMYVTGGSGGGVLTAWIVGNTNRFQAAVVAKPVINWYSFALTSDGYSTYHKYWFPGFPWDHPEHYMERSPISKVGNVETPTMLLTGEEDLRTPIGESEQFYQALKLRKIDTALVRVPGASHGIAGRPSHLIAKVAYILKWFETHP
ncbi:MAG: S9 family peptidase [Planctomycetaceae bacterium]|nr:S9 family peptidase [Planctomycetaceae bacterium]MDG1806690.1 S9 family peptidase [Pirellulaceae bacterium]MDG2103729.1 S9 family peptidase [Pirellulaceae bacterium]